MSNALVSLTMSDIRDLAMIAGLTIVEEVGCYGAEGDDHFTIHDCPKEGVRNDDGTVSHYRYVALCDGFDAGECQPLGEPILTAQEQSK